MKTLNAIVKIVTALAAVAGAIYVAATYGDQIVAWCKKFLASLPKCAKVTVDVNIESEDEPIPDAPSAEEEDFQTEEPAEEPAEEAPVEEAEEETPVEEIPLTPVAPNEPVAEEHDFAE